MKIHFFSTFYQIVVNDSVNPLQGLLHQFEWLIIRAFNKFPRIEKISNSYLWVDKPNGPSALVHIFGKYDYHNMNFIQQILLQKSELWFIDVGANIGTYTLIAAETGANVLSIEPHPITNKILRRNVIINGYDNVIIENCAATDRLSSLQLSDYKENAVNKIINNGPIPINGIPLDDLISKYNIGKYILKIDTEGHDLQVLHGVSNYLKNCIFIIVEDANDITQNYLLKSGFSSRRFYDHELAKLRSTPQRRREDPIFVNTVIKLSPEMKIKL